MLVFFPLTLLCELVGYNLSGYTVDYQVCTGHQALLVRLCRCVL